MEEGQAKIPKDVQEELKSVMSKVLINHLKPLYTGEVDIDVTYEGFTEQNNIFNVAITLLKEDGASINFHTMQKTALEEDNIRIWPDLRTYGADTRIRFTLYLELGKGKEEKIKI